MAITQATQLADFTSGIGTAGAILEVDNVNNKIGIGTTNPQALLQVGQIIKMDGVTGIITATTFSGNFTGNATGLSGTPNITVNNIVAAAATFSGEVTYEDVTNIDSIGIVTARSGIHVDDSITHIGDTNTKIRFPSADTFTVETSGVERFRVDSTGDVGLVGIATATGLVVVAGSGIYAGHAGVVTAVSFDGNVTGNSSGTHTGAVDLNGGVLTLDADADTTITADTDDQIDIAFGGNDRITLSTGLIDLKNDGSQSAIRLYCESSNAHYAALQAPAHSAFSGNITLTLPATTDTLVARTTTDTLTNKTLTDPSITDKIIHSGDTNTAIRFPAADTFTVETAGSERVRVTSGGSVGINTASPDRQLHVFSTNGTVAHFESGNANTISQIVFEGLGASAPPNLGATGNDLHFTTNNTERLRIDSSGRLLVGTTSTSATCTSVFAGRSDGANDPVLRLEVNSTSPADGTALGGIHFASSGLSSFQAGARIAAVRDGGTWTNGSSHPTYFEFATTADGASSPTERLRITSAGLVRVPDNGKFTCGAGDDLQIYHDGSNSAILDNGTGNLKLYSNGGGVDIQKSNGEYLANFNTDGAVELYYDNAKKLETTATGVTVTGTLNATTALTQDGKGLATTGKAIAMAMVFG